MAKRVILESLAIMQVCVYLCPPVFNSFKQGGSVGLELGVASDEHVAVGADRDGRLQVHIELHQVGQGSHRLRLRCLVLEQVLDGDAGEEAGLAVS